MSTNTAPAPKVVEATIQLWYGEPRIYAMPLEVEPITRLSEKTTVQVISRYNDVLRGEIWVDICWTGVDETCGYGWLRSEAIEIIRSGERILSIAELPPTDFHLNTSKEVENLIKRYKDELQNERVELWLTVWISAYTGFTQGAGRLGQTAPEIYTLSSLAVFFGPLILYRIVMRNVLQHNKPLKQHIRSLRKQRNRTKHFSKRTSTSERMDAFRRAMERTSALYQS